MAAGSGTIEEHAGELLAIVGGQLGRAARSGKRRQTMDLESAVYVLLWREDLDRIPHARSALDVRPDWFELVYQNAGGRVCFVRGIGVSFRERNRLR